MSAEPNFHDADVTGVAYARDSATVELHFRHVGGEHSLLILDAIRDFRLNDFGMQNVVSRLLISSNHAFDVEEIREYAQWVRSQHDFHATITDAQLQDLHAAIARQEVILLVLEPSVGAEIVCLCTGFQHQTQQFE